MRTEPDVPEVPTTQVPSPDPLIVISRMGLPDQFETMHEVIFPTAKPIVATLGDRDGAPMLEGWVEAITATHGESVRYVGMADLSKVPKPIRGMVRKAIQKESPEFNVLLDWTGDVASFMQARPDQGNVFLIDVNGTIRAHFAGESNPADLTRISEWIARLIEEAPEVPEPVAAE